MMSVVVLHDISPRAILVLKFAAVATLEWQGKTYYFIGEETRQEFARQHESAVTNGAEESLSGNYSHAG